MDQTDTATGSRTNESFQPSEDGQKFDVFLSHSGKQKDFVRQLYKDLTSQGVSCFFDEDRESLPVAENFPPRIFEAAKTCKVAILLLSKDFLESKWPMLELCAFLEAKGTTNPNLKILPLFFRISPGDLKNTEENDKKWNRLEISREKQDEWHKALKTIRPINGLRFGEGGDEVKFRDEIVKEIWQMLPTPFPRYHVRGMQGEARMCQELAEFFNVVQPNKEGIRIAGLYGIAGRGKTTLGKAFCNLKLGDFEGKVCHLEFSRGNLFERIKLALQYLTHRPESVQTLTSHDQAQVEMYTRVKGQRVLLVLDNITEESIDEVLYYLKAELGENSWVLLSARSVDVLVKHFNIDSQSCMRVPRLEEEEAVAILLERAFLEESKITAEDRAFALRCAKRCLFKGTSCDIGPRAQSFHPLALKAFGGYLFNKCGSNLSKWVDQIDDMVGGSGDGLDEVFDVLCKAFDGMLPKYRTIFMLLTVYVLPNMSLHNVIEWMAINCNEEITFIEKAVQGLQKAAFIEEFKPEIRIHELYMEFAQRKAEEMGRWLCWKGNTDSTRGLIAQDKEGFELAKLEQCMYRRIGRKHLRNLCVLQLVHVDVTSMSKLDLGPMDSLRSITLRDCKDLEALDGMEKLVDLAWLQIRGVYRTLKLPDLSSFQGLQYLEIHITGSEVFHQLGDLSHCFNLREINVDCPSLLEFPRLKGMQHLKKVEFSSCDKVKGPLDCTGCVELQIIVLNHCCQMAASPLLSGCKKLSKLVLWECDAVPACPDVDAPNALKTLELFISSEAASAPKYLDSFCLLENLQLWNMRELMELPSFERLSNLTVLKLANCGIRELPDLTGCDGLEDVYLFTLKNLERLPDFSLLRELKKLSLCNCTSLECPPHIVGCHKLQMLHLLYNDNMKGHSKMDKCAQLEEIQVSWHSKDEVSYGGNDSDSCQVNEDLEFCLEYWKDEKFGNIGDVSLPDALKELEWVKGKKMLVKRYFRGVKLYYSLTAPYCWISNEDGHSKRCTKNLITLKIIDSKVMTFPTRARDSRDRDWVHKVNGYFAATKTDNPLASASSAPQQKHHVPAMQGGARMCLELEDFFYTVRPNIKGIRIAGLYGMVGQGKTSLCKTFCNLNLSIFDGKVCYLELSRGNRLDRLKIALQYLTHCNESQLDSMTGEYELSKMFRERLEGQRALLVLDNITEYSIREVMYYLRADLGENSYILLSGRSENVLANNFNINSESCMTVPCLEEEEAIAILLERTCLAESALGPENRGFALHCANKCSFKKTSRDIDRTVRKYHPLALKTFGRHLFFKHGADLSHWVAEADGLVFGSGDGLDDIFIVLEKAFDYMDPKNRTIFMLLTLYMQPIESPLNVNEWLAITCKEEIKYIKKAVEDLQQKGFIEEIKPEIRINDLYVEFAQSKPRWLWCKCDLVTSEAGEDETGVELVNAEYCQSQDMFMTGDRCVNNLIALKFVKLRLCLKECLRSISSYICEHAGVLGGMENSPYLALLNVGKVSDFKVFNLNILTALQYLEIDIRSRGEPTEVGDLTGCVSLREIYVCCDSLSKFPAINGLQRLEKASFKWCIKVIGPLDCSNCVMLQSIVFENCWQMAHIPLIVGCSNLSKIVLNGCKSIAEYSDEDESSALEMQELCISSEDASEPRHSGCCDGFKNQPLWNIVTRSRDVWSLRCLSNLTSRDVWSLRRLSNLTVLKLYKCDTDQPLDVTCCSMLEEVYFYKLKYLYSFPNFSSLRKLKILCLCYCKWVQAPPDIRGCEGLEVFHLLYNDDMKELPQMDGCPLLQEIKLSWPSKKAVPHRFNEEDDVEFCPDYQKDGTFENLNDVYMPVELKEWEWIQGKTVRVKKYSRERKEYYCMRAPYESEGESGRWEQASNADSLDPVTIPSAGAICQGFQQQV